MLGRPNRFDGLPNGILDTDLDTGRVIVRFKDGSVFFASDIFKAWFESRQEKAEAVDCCGWRHNWEVKKELENFPVVVDRGARCLFLSILGSLIVIVNVVAWKEGWWMFSPIATQTAAILVHIALTLTALPVSAGLYGAFEDLCLPWFGKLFVARDRICRCCFKTDLKATRLAEERKLQEEVRKEQNCLVWRKYKEAVKDAQA